MEQDRFDNLIDSADVRIVLDTNIILNLARYELCTSKNIIKIFEECFDLLWLPNQVFEELETNKNVIFNEIKKTKKTIQGCYKVVTNNLEKSIREYELNVNRNKYYPNKDKLDKISESYCLLKNAIESYNSDLLVTYGKIDTEKRINDIFDFINKLKDNNKVGNEITFNNRLDIIAEGELRYRYCIPPGFEDSAKSGIDKFGDLFVWKEILEIPRIKEVSNIIFLTNDVKIDWWELDKEKKPVKIHNELLNEFKELNSECNIEFLTLEKFQSLASRHYEVYEYAVYVDLNKDDDSYILSINHKLIEEIEGIIFTEDLIYFDSMNIGSEGIYDFEERECDFLEIIDVYELCSDNSEITYVYELKYNIFSSFISYEYWGRDEETKEVIISNGAEHEFDGEVIVSLERTILEKNIDNMNEDNDYNNFEIVSTNIKETKYEEIYDYDEDFLEVSSEEKMTCPDCGRSYPLEEDQSGFCKKCAPNH